MIKLQDIYKELLSESRRKDTINKYRERYSEEFTEDYGGGNLSDNGFDDFDHYANWLESELPHPKYLDYALDYGCCGGYGGEVSDVIEDITQFHRLTERNLIQNKDIYSSEYKLGTTGGGFVNADALKKAINSGLDKEKSKDKEKRLKKDRDAVYEDDRWRIIVPRTHEASCHYGAGTKWCTTMKDHPDHFRSYTKNGLLFYLIDKTTRDTFDSVEDVTYKLAVNWKWSVVDAGNEQLWTPRKMGQASTWYDATDNTIKKQHIIPLLPTNLLKAMETYYNEVIKRHNNEVRGGDYEEIFNEIEAFLLDGGYMTKVANMLKDKLPNETFSKINKGFKSLDAHNLTEQPGTLTLDFKNKDTYYVALLGSSQMVGHPQLLEIQNSDLSEDSETLLNDKHFWWRFGREFSMEGSFDYNNSDSLKLYLFKNKQTIFDNIGYFVGYTYKSITKFIKSQTWSGPKWDRETKTMSDSYIKVGNVTYWSPVSSASSYAFKYPPKPNSLTKKFLDAIRLKPGMTPKEFYEDTRVGYGGRREYYAGYNATFFSSLRDSGLVRRKKGKYGEYKYYIGPNYRRWVKGNLVRYNPY